MLFHLYVFTQFVFFVFSQCNFNTSYTCTGLLQGQYCGGYSGMTGCDSTNVYEYSSQGQVYNYGYRDSCAQCGGLICPSQSQNKTNNPIS
ncbi:1509_t:CDS:2, partial [Dentiscutata erythropus]